MATSTYPTVSASVNNTDAAVFIPELWSDDVIAGYKKNLIMGNLVTKINHVGKKGDTIHIPAPIRGSAAAKVSEQGVTIQSNTELEKTVSIDKHYEYSRLIEDITTIQALDSMRRFYTDDAGYALAVQIDNDIWAEFEALNGGTAGANNWTGAVIGGDGATAYDPTANTNAGNGSDVAEAGLLAMNLQLDNADVPLDGRKLAIPPVAKRDLLLITEYTSADYISGRPVVNGMIGNIYGSEVYMTSNCPTETADDTTTTYRVGALFHKDCMAFAEQSTIRTQTQYKQEYLADLMTADCLYGVGELRDTAGVAFVVPST